MERELASIIKFILNATDNPDAIFDEVKEGSVIPSVFFPVPEVESGGETLKTYRLEYTWYISFFHKSTRQAHDMAFAAYSAIKGARNLVHLVNTNGVATTDTIRLGEPSLKAIESGVAQLTIRFVSRRPYDIRDVQKAVEFVTTIEDRLDGTEITIPTSEEVT